MPPRSNSPSTRAMPAWPCRVGRMAARWARHRPAAGPGPGCRTRRLQAEGLQQRPGGQPIRPQRKPGRLRARVGLDGGSRRGRRAPAPSRGRGAAARLAAARGRRRSGTGHGARRPRHGKLHVGVETAQRLERQGRVQAARRGGCGPAAAGGDDGVGGMTEGEVGEGGATGDVAGTGEDAQARWRRAGQTRERTPGRRPERQGRPDPAVAIPGCHGWWAGSLRDGQVAGQVAAGHRQPQPAHSSTPGPPVDTRASSVASCRGGNCSPASVPSACRSGTRAVACTSIVPARGSVVPSKVSAAPAAETCTLTGTVHPPPALPGFPWCRSRPAERRRPCPRQTRSVAGLVPGRPGSAGTGGPDRSPPKPAPAKLTAHPGQAGPTPSHPATPAAPGRRAWIEPPGPARRRSAPPRRQAPPPHEGKRQPWTGAGPAATCRPGWPGCRWCPARQPRPVDRRGAGHPGGARCLTAELQQRHCHGVQPFTGSPAQAGVAQFQLVHADLHPGRRLGGGCGGCSTCRGRRAGKHPIRLPGRVALQQHIGASQGSGGAPPPGGAAAATAPPAHPPAPGWPLRGGRHRAGWRGTHPPPTRSAPGTRPGAPGR